MALRLGGHDVDALLAEEVGEDVRTAHHAELVLAAEEFRAGIDPEGRLVAGRRIIQGQLRVVIHRTAGQDAVGTVLLQAERRAVPEPEVTAVVLVIHADVGPDGEVLRQVDIDVGGVDEPVLIGIVDIILIPTFQGAACERRIAHRQGPGRLARHVHAGRAALPTHGDGAVETGLDHAVRAGVEADAEAAQQVVAARHDTLFLAEEAGQVVGGLVPVRGDAHGVVVSQGGTGTVHLAGGGNRHVGVPADVQRFVRRLSRGHDDHTVGAAGPVQGRRRRILDDLDAFDVVGVQEREVVERRHVNAVGIAPERVQIEVLGAAEHHAVHNPEGLAVIPQGIESPDVGVHRTGRTAVRRGHENARDPPLQQGCRRRRERLVQSE